MTATITRTEIKKLGYSTVIERNVQPGTTLRIGRMVYTKIECGWSTTTGRVVSSQTIASL